jgi:hypothetical protein
MPSLSVLCRSVSAAIVVGGVFFYSFGSRDADHRHGKQAVTSTAMGKSSKAVTL